MTGHVLDPEQYQDLINNGDPTKAPVEQRTIPFPAAIHLVGGGIFCTTAGAAQYNAQGVFAVGQWADSLNDEVGWYNVEGVLEVNLFPYQAIGRVQFHDGGVLTKIEEEGRDAIPE